MESMSMTDRVVRSNKRLPQSRYSPYILRSVLATIHNSKETNLTIEKQKEEAIRLGVELSLFVAEAMFILSDDLRSMLLLCPLIVKYAGYKYTNDGPVVGRLFCVMLYVFETYIKPKNGVYEFDGRSIQRELIGKCHQNFSFGFKELDRIVFVLGKREGSCGGVVKPSDFEHYNRELKKLEEMLRSAKDVSQANGFVRDEIKSNILHFWKSLFETPIKLIYPEVRMLEMFRPLLNQSWESICSRLIASLHI
ncbi:unnamed protein product [Arabidopsis thaliana]|uniref:Uncharacterized protein n=1 Tax=Arabidopsis thaliana TaxID=3702 RepID=A0A654ER43_ARATH|nr:unnamed protein product [Arabidopsis thaliana]